MSALSESTRGVFPAVLNTCCRSPRVECDSSINPSHSAAQWLRCSLKRAQAYSKLFFFYNYSSKFNLCDETVCSGTTLAIAIAQFSLSFSLRKAWNPVKSVWNFPETLWLSLFNMQIPTAVLQLQHYSLLFWQDETMPSHKTDLGNGKQERRFFSE